MKIALLSDIHGNSWALRAVLDDLSTRNIDLIVNLGDVLYGPLDPKGTFEILQTTEMIGICGNQDRVLLDNLGKEVKNETMKYVYSQLNTEALKYLESLIFEHRHSAGIYFCHASPHKDDAYLIEKLTEANVGVRKNERIDTTLRNIDEQIVVCGHSHQPRVVKTTNRLIINPGSVGLPAYDDDLPVFHKMESHNPWAKYGVLAIDNKGVAAVDLITVPYDFELAAKMAEKNNRPDWASWLRTGRA